MSQMDGAPHRVKSNDKAHFNGPTSVKVSFDLDGYERSFVCGAQTCTVNVVKEMKQ